MTDIASLAIKVDSSDMAKADTIMQGLGKTAGWLEGVVKKAMAAFGLYKVGEYIKEATLLAARYETLGVVMGVVGNNAGYTRQEMDRYATSLQKAGISMVESRNTLAAMAQAHLDLSKSTELARLAQDAAVIGNMNSSEAFQRMIYGIQSGQTDVLRTIGINVNFEQSYAKLAGTLGKTTKELSEAEKTTARMNAVLEKAPDIAGAYEASMGTAGKQLLSMKRYADDLMTVLGDLFGGALKVGVEEVNGALKGMKKWLEDNAIAASLVKDNIKGAAEDFVGLVKDSLAMGDGIGEITEGLSFMEIAAGDLAVVFAFMRDAVNLIVGAFRELIGIVAKVDQFFVRTFNLPTPEWLDKLLAWGGRQYEGGKAQYQSGFNATAMNRFLNGPTDPQAGGTINSLSGGEKAGASSNVAKILEQQRIWTARHTKPSGGSGGTGGSGDAGSKVNFYEMQDQLEALANWEDEYLKAESRIMMERQQSEEDEAAWEAAYLNNQFALYNQHVDAVLDLDRRQAADIRRVHTDLFGDLGSAIDQWSQNFGDAFVDACFTGKNAFSDLVQSMLKDLARMAVAQQTSGMSNWIASLFASGISTRTDDGISLGGNANSTPWYARAMGGPVSSGSPYIVGERGPELFVPGGPGTVVPNNKLGGVQVGSVSISISTSGDAKVTTDSSQLAQFGGYMKNIALQAIAEQSRPGGMLNPV